MKGIRPKNGRSGPRGAHVLLTAHLDLAVWRFHAPPTACTAWPTELSSTRRECTRMHGSRVATLFAPWRCSLHLRAHQRAHHHAAVHARVPFLPRFCRFARRRGSAGSASFHPHSTLLDLIQHVLADGGRQNRGRMEWRHPAPSAAQWRFHPRSAAVLPCVLTRFSCSPQPHRIATRRSQRLRARIDAAE